MDTFANLPLRHDPAEPTLPRWNGSVAAIPALLEERKAICSRSWYSTASFPDRHPYANKIRKELKQLSGIIVERESLAQAEFCAEVKQEYGKRLTLAQGDPAINEWDRPKRIAQVQRNFSGSQIEGMP